MKTLFYLLISLLFFSCTKTGTEEEQPLKLELSQSNRQVVAANNDFAFEFFSNVCENENTEINYMVSPLSLSLALGMAYNGSATTTADAFKNAMHFEGLSSGEINEFYQHLIEYLASNSNGSVMEIANSIWVEKTFPVKQTFLNVNQTYFDAEVQSLDFSNMASVDVINNWVSGKTHQKIPTIISSISPEERLFLINALYFNAKWKYEFKPEDTSSQPFYTSTNEFASAPMMQQTAKVNYLQNTIFSAVELPYVNDKFSMVVLLPNTGFDLANIMSQLNSTNWNQWLSQFQTQDVIIQLPKFKYPYEKLLNEDLMDLGLEIAFTDEADFSGISDIALQISRVLQKTYIDVNEEGTEAAAVTLIGFETTSGPMLPQFIANKPFLYVIKENTSGAICFIGKVGLPKYE